MSASSSLSQELTPEQSQLDKQMQQLELQKMESENTVAVINLRSTLAGRLYVRFFRDCSYPYVR